jgi:hypothetical protein
MWELGLEILDLGMLIVHGWVLVVPACTLPIQITFAIAFKLIVSWFYVRW